MSNENSFSGNIVDVVNQRIFKGTVYVKDGKIYSVIEEPVDSDVYIMPGFIDAHIHIESSMLIPSEFARVAVTHGTVATVSDPHEIANVLGIDGVKFMIENGKKVPFKFYFGAPSCVPATPFETSGAVLGVKETEELLKMNEVKYLAEMMNFPGVLYSDEQVMQKLAIAKKYNKVIDGHAPGLTGEDAEKYARAGITTDHECFTIEEALEKIKYGIKIQIREGSAAKNFDALIDLLDIHPDMVMLCSDDKHPDDLVKGHMNLIATRAVAKGKDVMRVLRCLTLNPKKHYSLDVGLLQKGDAADFIIVKDLKNFNVLATYIDGVLVAENGKPHIESIKEKQPNIFKAEFLAANDLQIKPEGDLIRVIEAIDGQLITNCLLEKPKIENNNVVSDTDRDILKMVVLNRYIKAKPAVGFIKNFGFKKGAIASTVAHDSHNIIAVGASDEEIVKAINLLIESKGGISLVDGSENSSLPLPVAGLMSTEDSFAVASQYENINNKVKELGTRLHSPYMTLSFMALLVIPDLKLSDLGLFDGKRFSFTELFVKKS